MKKANVFIGAVLFIFTLAAVPQFALAETSYTVKAGDSLWRIAVNHGTSVQQIKDLNSLGSSLIFPGQVLIISADTGKNLETVEQTETAVSRGTSRTEKILEYAKSFIGVPYLYGGQTARGFDCSGYLQHVFKYFGVNLPRTAEEQYNSGKAVKEAEARPGDIVAFTTGKYITHTGIYLGGGKFISATSTGGVRISSVYGPYWGEHFLGFSRIMP